jgi:hypothetical protein
MGMEKRFLIGVALLCSLANVASAQAPQPMAAQSSKPTTVDDVINRMIAREQQEMTTFRQYSPLIETYIQDMRPDKEMGSVPMKDHYFIGQADLDRGIVDRSMIAKHKDSRKDDLNPLSHLTDWVHSSYVPDGFLQMIYIDTNGFNREHYQFDYVRREFLGEVRCLVFDVTPVPKSGKGRFKGRIWVEDQDYTPVRFNGYYDGTAGMTDEAVHFDSWRINVQPGVWLPAYIFSQETDPHGYYGGHIKFRGQTRLWGYNLKNAHRETEFSEVTVDSKDVQDQSAAAQDPSPVEAERLWQRAAEQNVLERLQVLGLIAPPGEVDKVLDTVVNNIEVTNNLDIEPDVHCRILLTSTLESFSIGHTIVVSRGLLDVLPDEASLAAIMAQEIADIMVLKPDTDRWGFDDETLVSTVDALRHFSFRENPHDMEVANQKAVELLKNSPYKDKLASAGLFFRQLDDLSKSLPALINPNLGNRIMIGAQIETSAPELNPSKIDQIAALPLGARIKLDPYTDQVELLKSKPVPLISDREKMPFEVTPFMPFLTRYDATSPTTTATADVEKAAVAAKAPEQQ